jgi:hypothetical protein
MILIYSFLTATAFCYLAAAIYSYLGKPALKGIQKIRQGLLYCLICAIILLSMEINLSIAYFTLGILYSFATVSSFIGWPQIWLAHWKKDPNEGSDTAQIGMAFWDLALSVAFFYLSSI